MAPDRRYRRHAADKVSMVKAVRNLECAPEGLTLNSPISSSVRKVVKSQGTRALETGWKPDQLVLVISRARRLLVNRKVQNVVEMEC